MLSADHVVITTQELGVVTSLWSQIGFRVTPRGFHPFGTMNNLVILENTYIELYALNDKRAFDHAVREGHIPGDFGRITRTALETRDGPSLLAVTSDQPDSDLQAIEASGIDVSRAMHFRRPVTLPSGVETAAEFSVHFFEAKHEDSVPIFASIKHNHEALWVREWQDHENLARDVIELTYTCETPSTLRPYLTKLFGDPVAGRYDGDLTFDLGGCAVTVLTPDDFRERFASVSDDEVISSSAELQALTIRTRDLESTATLLQEADIRWSEGTKGLALYLGKTATGGTHIEFVAT